MYRKIIPLFVLAVVVASVAGWILSRDRLPREIRIAAGRQGGMYHDFAVKLKARLEKKTGRPVVVLETEGSAQNERLLGAGQVHLGLLQSGIFPSESVSVIAPLYHEPVLVVARKGLAVTAPADLKGLKVCIGPPESGMALSARRVLRFYDLTVQEVAGSFDRCQWDAAIITSGVLSDSLQALIRSGKVDLVTLTDAGALALSSPFLDGYTVLKGQFSRTPARPTTDHRTVAYTALLAVNAEEASSLLIHTLLSCTNGSHMRAGFPLLLTKRQMKAWDEMPLHPTAQEYFDPYGQLGIIASLMESLAATKELLFALVAAAYFLWLRLKERREKEALKALATMKEELDRFMQVAIDVDRRQIEADSMAELEALMATVTQAKLQALQELTDERLRSDNLFSIFLMQCHNVISKMQLKMMRLSKGSGPKE